MVVFQHVLYTGMNRPGLRVESSFGTTPNIRRMCSTSAVNVAPIQMPTKWYSKRVTDPPEHIKDLQSLCTNVFSLGKIFMERHPTTALALAVVVITTDSSFVLSKVS